MSPSQWRALPVDDRARMMAYDLVNGAREGYVAERQAAEMKDPKKKDREQTENAYQRQKREWLSGNVT